MEAQDFPWPGTATNSAFKQLRIYSDPYGVPLQTDTRPAGGDTLFSLKLAASDASGRGVSGNTRLQFSALTPLATDRVFLVRVHVDGHYLPNGKDFECVTNLHDLIGAGGCFNLPSLVQVPDDTVYGTCNISVRTVDQDPTSCRLRVVSVNPQSIVLSATAQCGAHIIDDLEVCTNLAPPNSWTLLKSYTNVVSPEAIHFDSGWTELERQVDPPAMPVGTSHLFRLRRAWPATALAEQ